MDPDGATHALGPKGDPPPDANAPVATAGVFDPRECELHEGADAEARQWLAAVLDCDPGGTWLRMEGVRPATKYEWKRAEVFRAEVTDELDIADDHHGNWGVRPGGRLVLLDYGEVV